jgi:hypothetical protein
MATFIFPSSYRCNCGHELNFATRTVRQMEAMSLRKPERVGEGHDPHAVEFVDGQAVAVLCPELGRCKITDTQLG